MSRPLRQRIFRTSVHSLDGVMSISYKSGITGAAPWMCSVRNNMHALVLLLLGAALSMRALAADIPLSLEDSGSREVRKQY